MKNISFSEDEGEIFFQTFINYLFLLMKKGFPISIIMDRFQEFINTEERIWIPYEKNKPIKMNEFFVLQYVLYNSDPHLQI